MTLQDFNSSRKWAMSSLFMMKWFYILLIFCNLSSDWKLSGSLLQKTNLTCSCYKVEAFSTTRYLNLPLFRRPTQQNQLEFYILQKRYSVRYGHTLDALTTVQTPSDIQVEQEEEEEEETQKSLVNDFVPKQMSLTESVVFFARYALKLSKETTIKRKLMGKQRTLSKLWSVNAKVDDFTPSALEILKKEVEQQEQEKKPFRETIINLNRALKELIHLVGYDAKLLIPCFGFAMLAAFMNSVIPHYYSMCVNCLVNAMTSTRHDIIRAMTGLAISSTLCALFTGLRGALFWLAGEFYERYNIMEVLSMGID